MRAEKAFPTTFMCRMLEVSTQGFYQWRGRPPSQRSLDDAGLTERIEKIHAAHGGRVGVRRVHDELRRAGVVCAHKRVHRLMRAAGLRGVHPRPYKRTTLPDRFDPALADLLHRRWSPAAPDTAWVGDVTYIKTWQGWAYVATVIDCYSRRVVASHEFRDFCRNNGVRPSVGRTGVCYDNAVAESFFATLKKELIHLRPWPTLAHLRTAVFEYIESYYNRRRRHSTIGYDTPIEYEQKYVFRRLQAA